MLVKLVRTGSHPAHQVRRARILFEFELDENEVDRDGPVPTQVVVAERAAPKVTGEVEVAALAGSAPPAGHARLVVASAVGEADRVAGQHPRHGPGHREDPK